MTTTFVVVPSANVSRALPVRFPRLLMALAGLGLSVDSTSMRAPGEEVATAPRKAGRGAIWQCSVAGRWLQVVGGGWREADPQQPTVKRIPSYGIADKNQIGLSNLDQLGNQIHHQQCWVVGAGWRRSAAAGPRATGVASRDGDHYVRICGVQRIWKTKGGLEVPVEVLLLSTTKYSPSRIEWPGAEPPP